MTVAGAAASTRCVLLAVGCALLFGAAGACGVPRDDTPRVVPAGEVPYGLLDRVREPSAHAEVVGPEVTSPSVYFVDADDRLVAVPLLVHDAGAGVVAGTVLQALAEGPTPDQRSQGLSSSLGPGVALELVEIDDGTARVDVSADVREPAAERLPIIAAEIVLSLTSVEGVDAVLLERAGKAVPAPLPGGSLRDGPVTSADYTSMLAPAAGGTE